jgi:hypothetical protein
MSLAHTGDLLVVAIAKAGSLGIDIERPRKRRYAAIADFLDWPPELWAQVGTPTPDEFLHLWTLWEALFKSTADMALADVRSLFVNQIDQVRPGVSGILGGDLWLGQSWKIPDLCWLSVVVGGSNMPTTDLFRVDRLADDVESAGIRTIIAPGGEFHF